MSTKNQYLKKYIWLGIFAIAMAYLESAVVIYLRAIMYPGGFAFPLVPIEPHLATTEIIREAATLIMLLGAAIIAGKKPTERFAWFIYCFAVWDIFYYVFLKLLLNWPASLMTWDILFLIPATWVGPVITPLLLSFIMLIFTILIIHFYQKGVHIKITWISWVLLIVGSLNVITAFIWDYLTFMLRYFTLKELIIMQDQSALYNVLVTYIPEDFNWGLFALGTLLIISGIVIFGIGHARKVHNMQ